MPTHKTTDNLEYNKPITTEEVKQDIKQKKNTATIPDKISYNLIKHMPTTALNTTLKLFNLIWKQDTLNTSWKHAEYPNQEETYHTASHMCKLLQTIINKIFFNCLTKEKLVANTQSRLRKQYSTINQIIRQQNAVCDTFYQ